jgi:hypothetical protein
MNLLHATQNQILNIDLAMYTTFYPSAKQADGTTATECRITFPDGPITLRGNQAKRAWGIIRSMTYRNHATPSPKGADK